MKEIFNFFISEYHVDLRDTKIFFISLNQAGYYNVNDDYIAINSNNNNITRELTIIHELTHRMITLNNWIIPIDIEEEYCKYVTLLYVEKTFGKNAVNLVKDLI